VNPILRGIGDIREAHVETITDRLRLIVGDLGLARFEAKLSAAWPGCMDRDESAFRVVSSFHRLLAHAAEASGAKCVLIDVGPNLGAINRSAIIAANYVVVPLAADLFSLQGLRNLGPNLREWRTEWEERLKRRPADQTLQLPGGEMAPVGYVVLQHAVRLDRPVRAYERWMQRIPSTYRSEVLDGEGPPKATVENDPDCLALLKNYRSLMPLAQDAQKPMFHLTAGDGALGGHLNAVMACRDDFRKLARRIAKKCALELPRSSAFPWHREQPA
jgi:cellulose biosynthesis protein BcsQ